MFKSIYISFWLEKKGKNCRKKKKYFEILFGYIVRRGIAKTTDIHSIFKSCTIHPLFMTTSSPHSLYLSMFSDEKISYK